MTDEIRTFIAIDLPDDAKQTLANFTETLKARGLSNVRWVKPNGIHLTLKFLGNIPPSIVPQLLTALEAAANHHPPFTLSLGDFGVFPNPNNPRVLWVGLNGDLTILGSLQSSVEHHCRNLGFDPDRRPFRPHLTLGRVRRTLPQPQRHIVRSALQDGTGVDAPPWPVQEIHLIHSSLTPQGAVYRSLGAIPLPTSRHSGESRNPDSTSNQ